MAMAEHNPDGWTFATLYQHIMALSAASKEAVTAAMNSANVANEKADKANEKRFDSVNEFRNALKDQQSTFADREQTDFRLKALENAGAAKGGKDQGISMVGALVVGTLMALASGATVAAFILNFIHR